MKKLFLISSLALFACVHLTQAQVLTLNISGSTLSGNVAGELTSNPNGNIGWTTTSYGTRYGSYLIQSDGNMNGQYISLWNNNGNLSFKFEGSSPLATLATQTFTAVSLDVNMDILSSHTNTYSFLEKHPTAGNSRLVANVSAIPEPSTYAAILGAFALVGLGIRRKLKK